MKYIQNSEGERVAVLKEEFKGLDPATGEEIIEEVVDVEATAALMNSEARRERAYAAEADAVRDRAMSYRLEAEGWRLEGEETKAREADARAAEALRAYVSKKAEIRRRYPASE